MAVLLVVGLFCATGAMAASVPLGDCVWVDANNNGQPDADEVGIDGAIVTVYIMNATGPFQFATTTTGTRPDTAIATAPFTSGWYQIAVPTLNDGRQVKVTVTLPEAYAAYYQTYDLDDGTTLTPSSPSAATIPFIGERLDVDFGYRTGEIIQPTYEIGDRVWSDANNSGGADDGTEPGIEGVTVKLYDSNDAELDSIQTDANGNYLFSGLVAGTYKVAVEGGSGSPLEGYDCTYDLSGNKDGLETVTLVNANIYTVDFSYYKAPLAAKVSISGFVFNDSNANGAINAGEPVLPGPTITLLNSAGAVVATQIADGNGAFLFSDLDAGVYQVTETNLPDYRSTNAIGGTEGTKVNNDAIVVLATTPGNSYPNQDFLDTGTKPGVDLVKTGPSNAKRGETVTYHFKITNIGNTWLYGGVTLNDPMLGGNIWHKTPVAPGEVNEFDVKYTIPLWGSLTSGTYQAPSNLQTLCYDYTPPTCEETLINTATATGCPPSGCSVTDTSSWTIKVGSATCSPYTTYTQGGWGACPSGSNPGTVLHNNWSKVYRWHSLVIGSCKTLQFCGPWNVTNFLPQGGCAGRLNRSYCNPTCRTSAGVFAGQVLALRLNVDFSNAGITRTGLGALKIQSGTYRGWTVAQFLSLAEKALGASACYNSAMNDTATKINESMDNGTTNTGYIK